MTDLDLRVLDLLCSQRVLTSPQLGALLPETPARTIRYRCGRLARLGLVGRSRPYRERGSAPHHLWPTRRGDAIVTGESPSRGGERREPNPLFLAHAAGLSEVYVALETTLPAGTRLTGFRREADARETFTAWPGGEGRAIAPDALVEIADADGQALLAFVELDMGTMSQRQLQKKASGYVEYARAAAWRERHPFFPALLFITTTEKRTRSFLRIVSKDRGRDRMLLTGSCDLARRVRRCATEPRWLVDAEDERPVDLLTVLREARRPLDEELAREEEERRAEEAERERLWSDPEALRRHLRNWQPQGMEPSLIAAIEITIRREEAMDEIEREAFSALGAMLEEPLLFRLAQRDASAAERRALEALVDRRRNDQRERVAGLIERFGEGPALRRARERISAGELFSDDEMVALTSDATRHAKARAEQDRLRWDYITWREDEARRLSKAQGLVARLRNRPDSYLGEVDRRALRFCPGCEETAFPDPAGAMRRSERHVAQRCHFCGVRTLVEFERTPTVGGLWS